MIEFYRIFLIFLLFSFIGYVAEIIIVSMEYKKLTNRGFLCGPICPIYGIGGLILWVTLKKYSNDYLVLFLLGSIFASILEYFTGYMLEKIFHNKWWDYSKHKYHLNGRVCMSNSIMFGIGASFVQLITPKIYNITGLIPLYILKIVAPIIIMVFIFDLFYSWISAFNLRKNIIIVDELKNNKLNALPGILEHTLKHQIDRIRIIPNRILKNFPKFILNYQKEFYLINKLVESQKERKKNKK